jgi:hypothetical protein
MWLGGKIDKQRHGHGERERQRDERERWRDEVVYFL